MFAHLGEELVAVCFPVVAPVRVLLAEGDLEAAHVHFADAVQGLADESAAGPEQVAEQLGMLLLEKVQQQQDEIGRVADVLNEHRDRHETVLRVGGEEVEHAGLAGPAGSGQH